MVASVVVVIFLSVSLSPSAAVMTTSAATFCAMPNIALKFANSLEGSDTVSALLPASFARIGSRASSRRLGPGAFLVFHVCLVYYTPLRLALHSLEGIMAQILKFCKKNVEKSPRRPELRRLETRSLIRGFILPDRRSGSASGIR